MPARSLVQMAQRACIKDIRNIEHVYDMPLKIDGADGPIKPVLWAIEQPDQLRLIEGNSPQIIGDDAEIWIKFIQRDVAKYADMTPPYPRNPDNWHKVYRQLVKQNQKEMDAQAAELKATMAGIRDAKLKNQLQSKDKSELPKLPKLGGMQYSDEGRIARQRAAAARAKLREETLGNAGVKTKDIFKKVHKERLEAAKLKNMFKPNHTLKGLASRITTAPRSMIEDYHKPPPPRSLSPLPMMRPAASVSRPIQRRTVPGASNAGSGPTMEAREKRLLALTNPSLAARASSDAPSSSNSNPTRASRDVPAPMLSTHQDKSSVSRLAPTRTAAASVRAPPASNASVSIRATNATPTLSITHKAPTPKRISPEPRSGAPTMKKKAPADIFMPSKRRRIS